MQMKSEEGVFIRHPKSTLYSLQTDRGWVSFELYTLLVNLSMQLTNQQSTFKPLDSFCQQPLFYDDQWNTGFYQGDICLISCTMTYQI